jgi:hypothetical protein
MHVEVNLEKEPLRHNGTCKYIGKWFARGHRRFTCSQRNREERNLAVSSSSQKLWLKAPEVGDGSLVQFVSGDLRYDHKA